MRSITPAPALVAALCLFCGVTAQRGNYVDEGAFDYGEPVPQRGAPRPAPAFRPSSSLSATGPKPTPVPILKQINRHNEDGSYTYGYEGADGAFKIETKLATGEVMGKYGYVDDAGKVRVVEYGANKYGFQPAGEGITVAPPTLVDETATKRKGIAEPQGRESVEYDDGQYYEEAPVRAAPAPRPASRPVSRPAPRPAPQPQYSQQPESQYSQQSQPQYSQQSQPHYSQQSQPQYSQQSQPQFSQQSQPQFSPDSFPSFRSSQNFGPAPSRPAPSSSLGPVPPRAAVAGAAPVGPAPSYSQPRPQAAAPRPAPRPQPQQQSFFAPAPVYESRPAPAPVAQSQPSRSSYGRSGGILDQLEKDYALPSNSAPALHDITFGSY